MTKSGGFLLLAAILASPLPADQYPRDRGGHEHDSHCGHERPGRDGHEHHGRLCGAVSVSSAERPGMRDRFSATRTLNLQFGLLLRGRDEEAHVVSFRVFTPKGYLYQELQVSQKPDEDAHLSRVSARLPVAGTFISSSSLYGRWRVVPYVDDDPEPCTAASVFTIVE